MKKRTKLQYTNPLFSSSGRFLMLSSSKSFSDNGNIFIFNRNGKLVFETYGRYGLKDGSISEDEKVIAIVSEKEFRIYDIDTFNVIYKTKMRGQTPRAIFKMYYDQNAIIALDKRLTIYPIVSKYLFGQPLYQHNIGKSIPPDKKDTFAYALSVAENMKEISFYMNGIYKVLRLEE